MRRILLKEKDVAGGLNIQLIQDVTLFALQHSYDVIMEGIFDSGRYGRMFENIIQAHPANNFFFYFDVSLEETLRRHESKPNKYEFGEKELRSWYKKDDFLQCISEDIISENRSPEEVVKYVIMVAGLR